MATGCWTIAGCCAEQLDQLKGIQQGRVRIICGEGFVADLIENGLRRFVPIYPTVRFTVELGSTEAVLDRISNGECDIGIVYNPVIDTRIKSLAIARQPLCLVAPPGHRLLGKADLPLADCLGEPCSLLSKGYGRPRSGGPGRGGSWPGARPAARSQVDRRAATLRQRRLRHHLPAALSP